MKYWCPVLLFVIVQYTSAQILNGIPSRNMALASNDRGLPGLAVETISPNGWTANNQMLRKIPAADNGLAFLNTANANIINNVNLANSNLATNAVIMAETNLVNANANPMTSSDLNKIDGEKLVNTNYIQNAEVTFLKDPSIKPLVANNNVPNILAQNNAAATGLKTQSLNLKIGNPCNCKNGIQGNIGNQDFGLHIAPDNLEILGAVAVSGRMPLYSVVTMNGNIPTYGQGAVNFSSGSRAKAVSV